MGGQDGLPCSHQAAVVKCYGVPSVNCIPTLSLQTRQEIAIIAVGSKAIQDSQFYASIHQEKLESSINDQSSSLPQEFSGPSWDLIRSSAIEILSTDDERNNVDISDSCDLVTKITKFSADIITRVKKTPAIAQAMETFLRRYDTLTKAGTFSNARLSSTLHSFGWVFGGTTSSSQGGYFRRGRRIHINAKSAGRSRGKVSKGEQKMLQGRPKGVRLASFPDVYEMPIRNKPKGKQKHSLQKSIINGTQNAGKW